MTTTTFSGFILLWAMMAGGNGGIDIVAVIPAKEYFKARDINPTIDKLIELAGDTPSSGKKQIAQLLAIRQLAAEVESVKKSPQIAEVRRLLQQIAQGEKANDPTGFAADYAKRTLVALDGGKEELPNFAGWKKGAAWIPKSVSFLGGLDSRGAKPGEQRLPDMTPYLAVMPKTEKEQLFDAIEKLGNVCIDRIVVGFGELEKDNFEFFVRVTGKANSNWFVEAYKGGKVEERAGAAEPKIRVLRPLYGNGRGPAMALVGDTDFLLAGIETTKVRNLGGAAFVQAADVTTLNKMLALIAKPGPDATQGVLKAELTKVPANASGVAVGGLASWMGKDTPFPMPQKIFAYAQRTPGGIHMQIQAMMDGEDQAKKLAQSIGKARDAALAQLGKLKGQAQPIPGANLDSIIALLEGIQLRLEADAIQVRLLASLDAIISISAVLAGR